MDIGNNNQMRVNPLDLPNVECEKCENIFYDKVTIIKKVSKVPKGDIEKAEKLREEYFNQKKL